jgi:putative Ca2+/H+ antiporter (TMEM165/GDT1 family)
MIFMLFAINVAIFLGSNAIAGVSMPEREHVQAWVWFGEFISFFTALVIAVFVWRISKRASKNKKTKGDDSKKS